MKKIFRIGILCLMVFTIFFYLWAADTGNIALTTYTSVAGGGVDFWEPTRASTADDSRSAASLATTVTNTSDPLRGVDLTGTGVPTGATINGVAVRIQKSQSVEEQIIDLSVRLVVAGTASGSDYATADMWPATVDEAYVTYGGSTDLWGLTLSAADVNGATFGVQISAQNDGTTTSIAYIDVIQIRIYYTEAATGIKKQVIGNLQNILVMR